MKTYTKVRGTSKRQIQTVDIQCKRNFKETSEFIPAEAYNQAIRNLNTFTFNDMDLDEENFFLDLDNEFFITLDKSRNYVLEFCSDTVYPLNAVMTKKINDWLEDLERDEINREAYSRDITETESYLSIASRYW